MAKQTIASSAAGDMDIPDEVHPNDFEVPSKFQEVAGVCMALVALFVLLSLITYDGPRDRSVVTGDFNLMGVAGEWTAYCLMTLTGVTAYLVDALVWITAISLFFTVSERPPMHSVLGMITMVILATVAVHNALPGELVMGHPAGGFIGELIGELLASVFSRAGTYLVSLGGIILITLLITDISLVLVIRALISSVRDAFLFVVRFIRTRFVSWLRKRKGNDASPETEIEPEQKTAPPAPIKVAEAHEVVDDEPPKKTRPKEPKIIKKRIVGKNAKAADDEIVLDIDSGPAKGSFTLPSTSLFTSSPEDAVQSEVDEQYLKSMADKLIQVLSDFGVYGEVKEIHPGPVVTMFEFQPKSGTKLSKIENLSNELAMALEVLRVRVVAPIPGKNAVGFELPNKTRDTVYLREMLIDGSFKSKKHSLPLALGKDISGSPTLVDLAKMPHLLIAGTTGSGKSVSVNAMLISLLFKHTPEDLRLLLIDPKMIELGVYDDIPHLLLPVVTDMSKATLALKWAVDEMERRYQLFADVGARNLASYNSKIERLKKAHEEKSDEEKNTLDKEAAYAVVDENVVVVSSSQDNPEKLEKLPFIVTVVDELADLMMVAAKDVEISIARLAQKARAAGIHLIIATQRPSVDVITGLIKANFPSRISFKVSSGTDSRTILGAIGAENLLGMGDMLILPPGTSDLLRVHGAYVDDEEINNVVGFLKNQGKPEYDEQILKAREDEQSSFDEEEKDEVYDQAVAIVAEAQVCSISMLQRKLRIGYNRSARIVEIMEKEGVVGPANGVNKREVLISPI